MNCVEEGESTKKASAQAPLFVIYLRQEYSTIAVPPSVCSRQLTHLNLHTHLHTHTRTHAHMRKQHTQTAHCSRLTCCPLSSRPVRTSSPSSWPACVSTTPWCCSSRCPVPPFHPFRCKTFGISYTTFGSYQMGQLFIALYQRVCPVRCSARLP